MPHPVFGAPSHTVETVEVKLHLPSRRNGHHTRVTAAGTCETKRGALWTYQETWTALEQDRGLQPSDAIHLLVLAALQDLPSTQAALNASLGQAGWEDVTLPF